MWSVRCELWAVEVLDYRNTPDSGRSWPVTESRDCSEASLPPSPGRCRDTSASSLPTRPRGGCWPRQGRPRMRSEQWGRWLPAGWPGSLSGLSSSLRTWWRAGSRWRGPPPPCWSWWARYTDRRDSWLYTTDWDQQFSEHSRRPGLCFSLTSTVRSGFTPWCSGSSQVTATNIYNFTP